MDVIVVIDSRDVHELLTACEYADKNGTSMSITIDNGQVKYKVGQFAWSPGYGKVFK